MRGDNLLEEAVGSGASMKMAVDCYSRFKAEESPIGFRLGAHPYLVLLAS